MRPRRMVPEPCRCAVVTLGRVDLARRARDHGAYVGIAQREMPGHAGQGARSHPVGPLWPEGGGPDHRVCPARRAVGQNHHRTGEPIGMNRPGDDHLPRDPVAKGLQPGARAFARLHDQRPTVERGLAAPNPRKPIPCAGIVGDVGCRQGPGVETQPGKPIGHPPGLDHSGEHHGRHPIRPAPQQTRPQASQCAPRPACADRRHPCRDERVAHRRADQPVEHRVSQRQPRRRARPLAQLDDLEPAQRVAGRKRLGREIPDQRAGQPDRATAQPACGLSHLARDRGRCRAGQKDGDELQFARRKIEGLGKIGQRRPLSRLQCRMERRETGKRFALGRCGQRVGSQPPGERHEGAHCLPHCAARTGSGTTAIFTSSTVLGSGKASSGTRKTA